MRGLCGVAGWYDGVGVFTQRHLEKAGWICCVLLAQLEFRETGSWCTSARSGRKEAPGKLRVCWDGRVVEE